MAPRRRSKRAARVEPAPAPAEEVGPAAQAAEAPQDAQSLHRLNREWHIAEGDGIIAQALFLPYADSRATDIVHDRGRFWACHLASGFCLRRSTPVSICGASEVEDSYLLPPVG
ncbi:hypothetical protein PIB30_050538 [Stylosanthes scabra]|uniref:Uncharacterized protein n=1 Tax=Stylosanthes scabra TaxID=79078 RepID=A0ABU6WHL4_9FABA|nr:hypothetical protein [Stylosanthes scabra]